jgi:Calx-beta domain
LTFAAGQTVRTILVPVIGDKINEPDETFFVTFTNPHNVTIARAQATGIIVNDDTPTIQLSSPNYTVSEGDGRAHITVTRNGDNSGAATVDYRTQDTDTFTVGCADTVNNLGSAYGRCDFATVVGTLSFAAGETTKSFDAPIIDDSYAEGNETFFVVLSNATGATLGMPSTATVTIIDNDTVNGPNPILQTNAAGVSFFVRQHYLDFLGREPEVGEPWSAILRGCADQFNTIH